MKKKRIAVMLSMLAVFMIAGCGKGSDITVQNPTQQDSTQHEDPDQNKPSQENEVSQQFQLLTSQAKDATEVISFLDANLPKVDQTAADQMFLQLEAFYDRYVPSLNDNFRTMLAETKTLEKMYEIGYPMDINNIKDETLKQWLLSQIQGKLALDNTEGEFFWKVDYAALQSYDKYLSDDLKSYLAIQAEETKKRLLEDGSMTISRKELGDRILKAEQYLTQYPKGQKRKKVKAMYNVYMNQYLANYRYDAIDDHTRKLLPDVKQSYEQLVKEHPDTKTAQLVKQYLDILAQYKDVIYDPSTDGALYGPVKQDISVFWEQLENKIYELFPS